MERVTLGRSGLSVSPIAFGTWQLSPRFWGEQPKGDAIAAMQQAFELGINSFDTADAYGDGYAETVLGEAIRGLPRVATPEIGRNQHEIHPQALTPWPNL